MVSLHTVHKITHNMMVMTVPWPYISSPNCLVGCSDPGIGRYTLKDVEAILIWFALTKYTPASHKAQFRHQFSQKFIA
jgi:hypothetical protein